VRPGREFHRNRGPGENAAVIGLVRDHQIPDKFGPPRGHVNTDTGLEHHNSPPQMQRLFSIFSSRKQTKCVVRAPILFVLLRCLEACRPPSTPPIRSAKSGTGKARRSRYRPRRCIIIPNPTPARHRTTKIVNLSIAQAVNPISTPKSAKNIPPSVWKE